MKFRGIDWLLIPLGFGLVITAVVMIVVRIIQVG